MSEIIIKNISLYHINLKENNITNMDILSKIGGEDIKIFINNLVANIFATDKKRSYKLENENENMSIIKNDYNNNFLENSKKLVENLLSIEKRANTLLESRFKTSIKKGSLLQIIFSKGELVNYTFISKIEHDAYLDEREMIKRIGMSYEKMVTLKYFLWNQKGTEYILGDTNRRISTYWWDEFFGLHEIRDNKENTTEAYSKIGNIIGKIKSKSFEDFKILNEGCRNYFNTQENFSKEDFKIQVFGNYTPKNDKVSIQKIKDKIDKLVDDHKFDSTFSIDKECLEKKNIKYDLGLGIKLEVPDNYNKTLNKITITEDDEGNKIIQIKTTENDVINEFQNI